MLTVIDFETSDPLLKTHGSGAVFKYHYEDGIDFTILGAGVKNEQEEIYIDFVNDTDAKSKLNSYMRTATVLVMHNASYDLACLKCIYKEHAEIEKYLPEIHDTMLIAKLVTQQLLSYSLDSLTVLFECAHVKESNLLHDYAWESGLYQLKHKEKTSRNCHKRPSERVLDSWCKTSMNLFPTEIVGEYCMYDVRATWDLYHKLMPLLVGYSLADLSKIIKICLKAKFKGLRLDLVAAKKLSVHWKELALTSKADFLAGLKSPIENINSGAQVGAALEEIGIKIPKTIAGALSIKKEWLEEQGHPLLKTLHTYRRAAKAEKDFIQKILNYQKVIPLKYRKEGEGVMFPSLKPLGATLTGRFSSGGGKGSNELNMLAVSGRDEHFGMPIRSLILPRDSNSSIVCADFSNQEPRLQVHYASLLACEGTQNIVEAWAAEPKMKYHKKVAELTNLEYDMAKMLTLGLSYGMGTAKTAEKLNISYKKAETILAQYHKLLPFMKQLQHRTAFMLKKNSYIKTLGGRRLKIDAAYEWKGKLCTNEHKAMSKLIQGSGLDQLWKAMIAADEAGLDFMLCVHDELIISSANPGRDAPLLVSCMENAYTLVVPVVAEVGQGANWLKAKPH